MDTDTTDERIVEQSPYQKDLVNALLNHMERDILDYIFDRLIKTIETDKISILDILHQILENLSLDYMKDCGQPDQSFKVNIEWLINHGCNINYVHSVSGNTVFLSLIKSIVNRIHVPNYHIKCQCSGNEKENCHEIWVLQTLLSMGCKADICDLEGNSAYHLVKVKKSENNHHSNVVYLYKTLCDLLEKTIEEENRHLRETCNEMKEKVDMLMEFMNKLNIQLPEELPHKKPKA